MGVKPSAKLPPSACGYCGPRAVPHPVDDAGPVVLLPTTITGALHCPGERCCQNGVLGCCLAQPQLLLRLKCLWEEWSCPWSADLSLLTLSHQDTRSSSSAAGFQVAPSGPFTSCSPGPSGTELRIHSGTASQAVLRGGIYPSAQPCCPWPWKMSPCLLFPSSEEPGVCGKMCHGLPDAR